MMMMMHACGFFNNLIRKKKQRVRDFIFLYVHIPNKIVYKTNITFICFHHCNMCTYHHNNSEMIYIIFFGVILQTSIIKMQINL